MNIQTEPYEFLVILNYYSELEELPVSESECQVFCLKELDKHLADSNPDPEYWIDRFVDKNPVKFLYDHTKDCTLAFPYNIIEFELKEKTFIIK